MNKTILASLVMVVALVLKILFDVEITESEQESIVTSVVGITVGVTGLVAVYKKKKKEKTK